MCIKTVHLLLCGFLFFSLLSSCGRFRPDSLTEDTASDSMVLADSVLIDSLSMADNAPSEDETAALIVSAKEVTPALVNRTGLRIYISKPAMRLFVVNNSDSVVFSCGIACGIRKGDKTGKGDYRTPEGDFSISGMFNSTNWIHHTRDGRSVKGCYGPRFLRLRTGRFSGIGIHGTNAPGSIGRRASEGCIRVNSANIMTIFDDYAYEGMPVVVSTEDAPLPPFKGLPEEFHRKNAKSSISEMPKEPVLKDDEKVADTTQTRPNMEHSAEVHENVDNHTEEHHSEGDSI